MQCVTSSWKRVILDYSSFATTEFSCFFCCVALKLCPPLVTNINELFSFILFIALMPTFFTCLFAFFIVWIAKRLWAWYTTETFKTIPRDKTQLSRITKKKGLRVACPQTFPCAWGSRNIPRSLFSLRALDDLERENRLAWEGMGESHNRNLHVISDLLPTILLRFYRVSFSRLLH